MGLVGNVKPLTQTKGEKMKTNYVGTDYSFGKSNRNHETGIHYGVIQANHVGQAWYEDSEAYYDTESCQCEEFMCDCEPLSFYIDNDEITAEQTADDPDIFILKSKYFTYCQYCSPCAPGAGYLENYTDKDIGIKAYCFGHDWFEDEKAPYPVYDIETGELV